MLKYNVDIYFSGHKHHALRSWPIAQNGDVTQQNYINPKGIVHITAGGRLRRVQEAQQPHIATLSSKEGRLLVHGSIDHLQFYNPTL